MPTIGPYSVIFNQRKASNFSYKEEFVSGSDLLIMTGGDGVITGSKYIPTASIGNLTSSTSNFGTVVVNGIASFFDKIYAYAGIIGNITGSLSGSRVIANNITTVYLTASYISGSVESSSYAANADLLDNRDSTTYASTASNIFIGDQVVTGSVISKTGSFNKLLLNDIDTAPTNIYASGISGEIRVDRNYIYMYTNNMWHRIPKALWD